MKMQMQTHERPQTQAQAQYQTLGFWGSGVGIAAAKIDAGPDVCPVARMRLSHTSRQPQVDYWNLIGASLSECIDMEYLHQLAEKRETDRLAGDRQQ
nr:uncharacterized protein CTRU02_00257 [Colletotrichum truncatum]KAF6801508.1 hypothetical protein CTRU02_00257 [Colletotrichum truncatum]